MNAVGKQIGIAGQTVERWLVSAGVPIRNRRRTYPDRVRNEAISIYVEERISAAAVAKRLGLKSYTVKEWLSAAGVIRSKSDAASLDILRGRARSRSTSRLWHTSSKTGERNFAESSLEFMRMNQLDRDTSVASWGRCPHRIPYVGPNGHNRHYVPDLLVISTSGMTVIEEVKPVAFVGTPINLAKFAACRSFCEARGWSFRIITEADVGYARSLAPTALSKDERRRRHNEKRRQRWAAETPEQRAARLKRNADYMREFNRKRRTAEAGTNVPTGMLKIRRPA
jgi:hypothetical protein